MKTSFLVCLIGVVIVHPTVSYSFGDRNSQYLRRDLQYDLANIAREGNSDSDKYSLNLNAMNAARQRNSHSLYQALRSSLDDSEDDYNHSSINYRNSDVEDQDKPSNIKSPDENGANEEFSQNDDQFSNYRSQEYNYMAGDPTYIDDPTKYQGQCGDCLYKIPHDPHEITETEKRFGFPFGRYGRYGGIGGGFRAGAARTRAYGGGSYGYGGYGFQG